eukprot:6028331-Prymnesium_polylepis.1
MKTAKAARKSQTEVRAVMAACKRRVKMMRRAMADLDGVDESTIARYVKEIFDAVKEPSKSLADLEEEQRVRKRKQRAEETRRDAQAAGKTPERMSVAGPSHTPRTKMERKQLNNAEQLDRLQWKERAPERAEAGRLRQAEAHRARIVREQEAEAAAAEAAFSEAQKAIALASNPKPPTLTVADVAGL